MEGVIGILTERTEHSCTFIRMHARARANGVSARDRQREKHARYPGPGLVAAVVEAGGRLGGEFQAFLKAHAPAAIFDEDVPIRSRALQDARMRVVIAVARGTASMLLSAAGDAPRPWRAA